MEKRKVIKTEKLIYYFKKEKQLNEQEKIDIEELRAYMIEKGVTIKYNDFIQYLFKLGLIKFSERGDDLSHLFYKKPENIDLIDARKNNEVNE